MEAVGGLDYLGDAAGLEGHGGIGELRPEDALGSHSELAALAGRAGVFRIQTRQRGELLPSHDTFADCEQTLLARHRRRFTVGIDADLAHLVFDRDDGEALHICGIEILTHIVRGELGDVFGYFLLFLLDEGVFFELVLPLLTELENGLAEVFLRLFVATEGSAHLVYPLGKLGLHHLVVHLQGVDAGLHEEELGLKHALEEVATGVAVRSHALGAHHLHLLLEFAQRDELATHDRYGLVDYAVVFLGLRGWCAGYEDCRAQQGCADYLFSIHLRRLQNPFCPGLQ